MLCIALWPLFCCVHEGEDRRPVDQLQLRERPALPHAGKAERIGLLAGEAAARLMVNHAASPLDRANFLPLATRPAPSCDRRLLAARLRLDGGDPPSPAGALRLGVIPAAVPSKPPSTPPSPCPPALESDGFGELRSWLMEPQRDWLRRLGMRPRPT